MNEIDAGQPTWIERLTDLIHRHWTHHAPCSQVSVNVRPRESGEWHVEAAPILLRFDGSLVWAGFTFDVAEFSRAAGITVDEQTLESFCTECTPTPKLVVNGTFEEHPFVLSVYLEPLAGTEPAGISDPFDVESSQEPLRKDSATFEHDLGDSSMSRILDVSSDTFPKMVLESPLPTLVDVYSPTCRPCQAVAPIMDEMAVEVEGRARIVKLNAREEPDLVDALQIRAFPTFVIFQNGEETARIVGFQSKKQLREALGVER